MLSGMQPSPQVPFLPFKMEAANNFEEVSATAGTQTDRPGAVEGLQEPLNQRLQNGSQIVSGQNGGFLSNMLQLFSGNTRNTWTQTEEELDPINARGRQLSYYLIQELALHRSAPPVIRDHVYESFCFYVTQLLRQNSDFFDGMLDNIRNLSADMFSTVANAIFEAGEDAQLRVSWGRIVSLYAFAVRLAQEYKDNAENVEIIRTHLSSYVAENITPFVRESGGWERLVKEVQSPPDDAVFGKAVLWSGLCMGIVATMYISSLMK